MREDAGLRWGGCPSNSVIGTGRFGLTAADLCPAVQWPELPVGFGRCGMEVGEGERLRALP